MEDQWIADRACLRRLLFDHPDWRLADFAQVINHSISWVCKWRTITRIIAIYIHASLLAGNRS